MAKELSISKNPDQPHADHRARLKERFRKEGGENFTDAQFLELLLFAAIPRKDVNPVAQALLRHFGTFFGVIEADEAELRKVEGIGESTALYLTTFLPLIRRYLQSKNDVSKFMLTAMQYGNHLIPKFLGMRDEAVYLMCFDAKSRVIFEDFVNVGTPLFSMVSIRKITEIVTRTSAVSIVVAHNHPNGFAVPTKEDVDATYALVHAMTLMETRLMDHVVVSDDDFVSLAESKEYAYLFSDNPTQQMVANVPFYNKR